MKFETDRLICYIKEGLAHVRFKGPQVTEYSEASLLGPELRRIVGAHDFRVMLVDCEAVDFVTSTMLEALVTVYLRCRKAGRELRLVNITPLIRDLLRTTQLDVIIPIYDHLHEALDIEGRS